MREYKAFVFLGAGHLTYNDYFHFHLFIFTFDNFTFNIHCV